MNPTHKCSFCGHTGSQTDVQNHIRAAKASDNPLLSINHANATLVSLSTSGSQYENDADYMNPSIGGTTSDAEYMNPSTGGTTSEEIMQDRYMDPSVETDSYGDDHREPGLAGGGELTGGSSSPSGSTATPTDTRTQVQREADFYRALADAKTAAASGNPRPLQDFDRMFNITRNPDEYKRAFYADYSHPELNSELEGQVRQWFIDRDANNDGQVGLNEMGEHAREINKDYVGADGKLSIAEGYRYHVDRANSIEAKVAASGLPQNVQQEIIDWTLARDANKDGLIQRSEMGAAGWNSHTDEARADGSLSVEDNINYHRRRLGMSEIDYSRQNTGDIAPVSTTNLSSAERLAMSAATTPTVQNTETAAVSIPESRMASTAEQPMPMPMDSQSDSNVTVENGAAQNDNNLQEMPAATTPQNSMNDSNEGAPLTVSGDNINGDPETKISSMNDENVSEKEPQEVRDNLRVDFPESDTTEGSRSGATVSASGITLPDQAAEEAVARVSDATDTRLSMNNSGVNNDSPKDKDVLSVPHGSGEVKPSVTVHQVAEGGSVTELIQDIAEKHGNNITGKQAFDIYKKMKEDFRNSDNTYVMENGEIGLVKPGAMHVDASIVNKVNLHAGSEMSNSAARINPSGTKGLGLGRGSHYTGGVGLPGSDATGSSMSSSSSPRSL